MKLRVIATTLLAATLLVGCGSKGTAYNDGTYEGTAAGLKGDVKVSVTVTDSKISNVEVVEQNETPEIAGEALESVPAAIVEKNSTDVETVSGATVTSTAIIDAVNAALEQAK